MAEVVWQARRTADSVLVDVTGDTTGTPAGAPTPNPLEGGAATIYVSATDPGAVGAGNLWLQVETFPTWWVRNEANNAWLNAGAPTFADATQGLISSPANNAELSLRDNAGSTLFAATSFGMESGDANLTLFASTGGVHLGNSDVLPGFFPLAADPTAGAGVAAPSGSVGLKDEGAEGAEVWIKASAADTDWLQILRNGPNANIPQVPAIPTAQNVVDALVALGLITQAV